MSVLSCCVCVCLRLLLQRGWNQSADGYYSFSSQQQRTEEVTIPSTELAQQVIEYARQLEMIV